MWISLSSQELGNSDVCKYCCVTSLSYNRWRWRSSDQTLVAASLWCSAVDQPFARHPKGETADFKTSKTSKDFPLCDFAFSEMLQ